MILLGSLPYSLASTAPAYDDDAADLRLAVSASAASLELGDEIVFTIQVANLGPDEAEGIVLTNTLPWQLDWVSTSSFSFTCSGTSSLVCDLDELEPGEAAQVLIQARAIEAGEMENIAEVSGSVYDPDPENNTVSTPVLVTEPQADLSLQKSANPITLLPGGELTFTLAVLNSGPARADGVVLTEYLPPQLNMVSIHPSLGSCLSEPVLYCSLGMVPAGSEVTVVLVAALAESVEAGTLRSHAQVTYNTADPFPDNNTAYIDVTVTDPVADLHVTQAASTSSVIAGNELTFTIDVSNQGPQTATGVIAATSAVAQASLLFASASQGSCSGTHEITCELGDLAAGEGVRIILQYRVFPYAQGQILHTVSAAASENDPDPGSSIQQLIVPITSQADLHASITASPDPAAPGDLLQYQVQASNQGPSTAGEVTLVVTLPDQIIFQSFTPPEADCVLSGRALTCSLGSLEPEEIALLQLDTIITEAASGTIGAQAQVSSPTPDPQPQNNLSIAITRIASPKPPDPVDLTLNWLSPVESQAVHFVSGEKITLRVEVSPSDGVSMVYFERWDINSGENGAAVSIGVVFEAPFVLELDTGALHLEWNEVRAWAFDISQTPVVMEFIWLYRLERLYLPLVTH
jgi:uncharacterized repeat protein (TIGR01451 family)